MRPKLVPVALVLALSIGFTLAQPPGEAPKPGPEHEKLGYFVGKWTSEGVVKANPFMPEGAISAADTCEWFEGGFAVVCRAEGKGPMGPSKSLAIMGYSTEEKVYTYYGVENGPMGMTTVPRGTVEGATWLFTDESKMGGKSVKSRYVLREVSPTSYTWKWEILGADGGWQTVVEGTSKKRS